MDEKEIIRRLNMPNHETRKSTLRYLYKRDLVTDALAPLVARALTELNMRGDTGFIDMLSRRPCGAFFEHYLEYLGKRAYSIRSSAFAYMEQWLAWAEGERKEKLLSISRKWAQSEEPYAALASRELLMKIGEVSRDEFLEAVVDYIIAENSETSDILRETRETYSGADAKKIQAMLDEKGRPDLDPWYL